MKKRKAKTKAKEQRLTDKDEKMNFQNHSNSTGL